MSNTELTININPTLEGEASYNQGADHTGMQIGNGANSYRFYTDDADQVFFSFNTGNDTTGDGSRSLPYKTIGKAQADVDGITKFCTTCLDSYNAYSAAITKVMQVDPGQTPEWDGAAGDILAPMAGFKIKKVAPIINTTNFTDKIINCTFDAAAAQTVTHTKGFIEKCFMNETKWDYNTNYGFYDMQDCEFILHTNSYIQMKSAVMYIDNTIFHKLRADVDVIDEFALRNCTCINASERLIDLGSQSAFGGLLIKKTILIDKSNNNMFDTDPPSIICTISESVLVTDSTKYAFLYTSVGMNLFSIQNGTIVARIKIAYNNPTYLDKLVLNNVIIENYFELIWTPGGDVTTQLSSGNIQDDIFAGSDLTKRGGQVFDVDPLFSDADNNEYFLSYKPKNSVNSPLKGKSFAFGGQGAGYDMGAFWDADYSGLANVFQDSLTLLKPDRENQIKLQETAEFSKLKGITGEITIYYDPATREEILVINYDGIESIYIPVIEKLRENADTNVQLALNLEPNTSGTVTVDGNQSIGAVFLQIDSANISPGTKIIINEIQYLILWAFTGWTTATKLILDKALLDDVVDDQVLNTTRAEFEAWKYIPENINLDYETSWSDDTRNNLILRFSRKKP
jgi:hypothetical protein